MTDLIVFVCGILAAASNGVSSILQRMAAGRPEPHELFSGRFFAAVTKNKLFLIGLALQILAAALQAVALSKGPLTLVEPLLTLDLVVILLVLHFVFHRKAGIYDWLAVSAIIVGLTVAILAARPTNGIMQTATLPWLLAGAIAALFVCLGIFGVRRARSATMRTALAAGATSVTYAMTTGLAKLVLTTVQLTGWGVLFTRWPIYAFILFGVVSLYLMQNAYAAGPLTISQPIIEIMSPLLSISLGVFVLKEQVAHSARLTGRCTRARALAQ